MELGRMCSSGKGDAMPRTKGFSLIELLIVVAIILIIAAVAVPNFLRSRLVANESAAAAGVRTVNTAQISYYSSYPTVGYASALSALGGTCTGTTVPTTAGACLLDSVLAGGTKSGYSFGISNTNPAPNAAYNVIAAPISVNLTGVRYFCSFADAVIRVSEATITTCDSTIPPQQ
jgi:type IV pilus assembly protein PilA